MESTAGRTTHENVIASCMILLSPWSVCAELSTIITKIMMGTHKLSIYCSYMWTIGNRTKQLGTHVQN